MTLSNFKGGNCKLFEIMVSQQRRAKCQHDNKITIKSEQDNKIMGSDRQQLYFVFGEPHLIE